MLDAVSELKLLNYGSLIPAEFWPDPFTRLMDENKNPPRGGVKTGCRGGGGKKK